MTLPKEVLTIRPIHLLIDTIEIYSHVSCSLVLLSREIEHKLMWGYETPFNKTGNLIQMGREVGLTMTFESENSFTIILDPWH